MPRSLLDDTPDPLKRKMVPERIRIDPLSEVARGHFGDVRAGYLEGKSEKMAIKELRPRGDAEARRRVEIAFARELKVWETLDHRNLLSLVAFHIDFEQGILQFVSEYAEAGNVSKYLNVSNPDMPTRLQLSLDTANGLSYLHGRNICHGDLKGENVLIFVVNDRPSARLCDFGLSRIREESPSGLTTSTYHGKGTLSYLSPELLESTDPKRDLMSDMWAWACVVLEEITTNQRPYSTVTRDYQIPLRIMQGSLPADEDQLPKHDGVRDILKQCWKLEPMERPTIEECRGKLSDFIGKTGESRSAYM